ncbi:hypothetical protein CCR75_003354 [Bremia lactucae]|uniref:Uncharacterized protein n=1 Tax=Bremia lactucae TaxID=4779 RepID=A0A976FH75_BRELC|nr:hypothetical protein CCR75_003354 [Bremia lactucae]
MGDTILFYQLSNQACMMSSLPHGKHDISEQALVNVSFLLYQAVEALCVVALVCLLVSFV